MREVLGEAQDLPSDIKAIDINAKSSLDAAEPTQPIQPSAMERPVRADVPNRAPEALAKPIPMRVNLKVVKVKRIGKHKGYTVDVTFPRFVGEPRALVRQLNAAVVNIVDRNIAAVPGIDGSTYSYRCNYRALLVEPDFVSLDFKFDDFQGGAHGGTHHECLNWQLVPKCRKLRLKDILGRRLDAYVQRKLSNLCVSLLRNQFGAQLNLSATQCCHASLTEISVSTNRASSLPLQRTRWQQWRLNVHV